MLICKTNIFRNVLSRYSVKMKFLKLNRSTSERYANYRLSFFWKLSYIYFSKNLITNFCCSLLSAFASVSSFLFCFSTSFNINLILILGNFWTRLDQEKLLGFLLLYFLFSLSLQETLLSSRSTLVVFNLFIYSADSRRSFWFVPTTEATFFYLFIRVVLTTERTCI